ncbi:hypothetical protein BU204_13785 [Actinophytocola xanthii]|uniref:YfhO family protein n=1 Tax=Actinophytocola xanthii TaxID=1912961 RepID=A0A1Q8CRN5_9PSEU|nr:hypothetical protein BU204_13785 [Actinophytocola xanthii]
MTPPETAPPRRARFRPELVATLVIVASVIAFVAYRLGPSLVGARVFLGLDLFGNFPPWKQMLGTTATNFYVFDNLDFFVPAYNQIQERLFQGDLATWSPYAVGGTPLLSLPIFGVLSPARMPYLFLPDWLAPAWSKLVELVIAGGGAYLLLRRLRAGKPAALLAALCYPLTGFMLAWASWPQAAVAALIPALFWSVERFVQERRVATAVPIAVVVAWLLFGGFPAVAGLALYAAGAYFLVRLVASRPEWRHALRDVAVAGAAVATGVAASAVQLLPFVRTFLAEVDLSYREAGFERVEPLSYLASTVLPGSFAGNHLPVYRWPFNPIEVNAYLGSAVLVLAGLALLRRTEAPRAARTYLAALAALSVLLIWVQGPLLSWLGALPVFADNPIGRIRALMCFAVAILAALGFDALLRREPRKRLVEALVLIAGVAVLGVVAQTLVSRFGDALSAKREPDLWLAVGGAAVVAVAVLLAGRWRLVAAVVVPVVIAVQGLAASAYYWPTGEREHFYATSEVHTWLAEHTGTDRVATEGLTLWPNTTAPFGIRTVNGHAFTPKPMKELITAIDPRAFGAPTMPSLHAPAATSPGLDRLAARYWVTTQPADLREVFTADGVVVYERPDALSRIRWAPNEVTITDQQDRLAELTSGELPADTVVLSTGGEATDGQPAQVEVLEDGGDTIRVRVDAEGAGYLVVADNVQTDWVATVDGNPVDIVAADHAVGAVHVDGGEHEIELRYSPRGRTTGTWLSLTAVVLLIAAAIPPRFWRRRRQIPVNGR